MRIKIFCMLLIVSLFLTGCYNSNTGGAGLETETTSLGEIQGTPFWRLYEGELIKINKEELPLIEITESGRGTFCVLGTEYEPLRLPDDKFEVPTASGWRVDLDNLYAKGQTGAGDVVLMAESHNSPIICILDEETDQLKCLLRKDIAHLTTETDLNMFEIYVDGGLVHNYYLFESIWLFHVGNDAYQVAYPILDGDWDFCSFSMVCKETPALRYELNISFCCGKMYIENLPSNQEICTPFDYKEIELLLVSK